MRTRNRILKEIENKEQEIVNFNDYYLKNYISNSSEIVSLTDKQMEQREELFEALFEELEELTNELNMLERRKWVIM